jgi:hypothetical protein
MAVKRALASVMLAVVALSLATPPHAAAGAACPESLGAGGTSALVAAMDHGGCQHAGAGPCLTAVGCLSAPPVLRPATATLLSPLAVILTRPAAAPHYADLCRTGPPTPPPNSI